jgi:hypothetical protein
MFPCLACLFQLGAVLSPKFSTVADLASMPCHALASHLVRIACTEHSPRSLQILSAAAVMSGGRHS